MLSTQGWPSCWPPSEHHHHHHHHDHHHLYDHPCYKQFLLPSIIHLHLPHVQGVIAWDHVGVQVQEKIGSWCKHIFFAPRAKKNVSHTHTTPHPAPTPIPASMTLLSPPTPPNQTLNGWVKWWLKSMDPTLVPSINDAFLPPPTKP